MCRFLLAQSDQLFSPQDLLERFADMAKKSKAFDGDWQGDGWGVSWLDSNKEWQLYRSLKPVWEDRDQFKVVSRTSLLTVHARSASFPDQKGNIEFNQPFLCNDYSFVFNGLLKGVKLSIPGTIGAQKIWSLLQTFLTKYDPPKALEKVKEVLIKNSQEVQALNIGLASKTQLYSLNYFTKHTDYYTLHSFKDKNVSITCSEML